MLASTGMSSLDRMETFGASKACTATHKRPGNFEPRGLMGAHAAACKRCIAQSHLRHMWMCRCMDVQVAEPPPPHTHILTDFSRCFRMLVTDSICFFLAAARSFCFSACTCLEYCLASRALRLRRCASRKCVRFVESRVLNIPIPRHRMGFAYTDGQHKINDVQTFGRQKGLSIIKVTLSVST